MLPPERLVFGNRYEETASPKGDWSRAATSKPVLTAVNMNKWAIFLPEKSKQAVQAFCKALQQQAPRMGIQIANPKVIGSPWKRVCKQCAPFLRSKFLEFEIKTNFQGK